MTQMHKKQHFKNPITEILGAKKPTSIARKKKFHVITSSVKERGCPTIDQPWRSFGKKRPPTNHLTNKKMPFRKGAQKYQNLQNIGS